VFLKTNTFVTLNNATSREPSTRCRNDARHYFRVVLDLKKQWGLASI